MKKILTVCCLVFCILLTACTKPAVEPSSSSTGEASSVTESAMSSDTQSDEKQKKYTEFYAPSEVGYQYQWDDTLNNIYAPSEAYPMGDAQPGGEPIHIEPRVEQEKQMDVIWLGGDVMGNRVAYIQAVTRDFWNDPEFIFSSSYLIGIQKTETYTKEEMTPYLIREDEDYVLLDITELVLGSSFEEFLKQKAEKNGTSEVMYSWALEPAAHLQEHLSEIIVKE